MPRVRCLLSKMAFGSLQTQEQRAAVEAQVCAESILRPQRSLPISWAQGEGYVELTQALRNVLGDDGLRAHFRRAYVEVSRSKLLGPLTDAYLRLYDQAPAGLARGAPRGWKLMSDGMGELSTSISSSGEARIQYTYDPQLDDRTGTLPLCFAGTFDGFFDRCGIADGRCLVANLDAKTGTATFVLPAARSMMKS
ncbi:MAG: hypothetical protein ACRBN8_31820 [Nannocystales bacterium]